MNDEPTSQERLRALDSALDKLAPQPASQEPRPARAPRTPIKLGPKTEIALRWMKWGFSLFWLLWIALAMATNPPEGLGDLIIIPGSALIVWFIYLGHRFLMIAAVHRLSRTP